jgi:23S rRNA pseudouridine2605 synthase
MKNQQKMKNKTKVITVQKKKADFKIRLNKFISESGYCSRRKADELIQEGRVSVNTKTITELGTRVDASKDKIKIDGEPVKSVSDKIYIILNKPKGYVTTTSDEKNRPTVIDLIKINKRVYPVGRLDYDSEGLLLLTNDGDLANKLMHPKFGVYKTYLVKVNKSVTDEQITKLRDGVKVDDRITAKANVRLLSGSEKKQLEISIYEGRNRQVRKMLESMSLFVRNLKRISYAGLELGNLKKSQWRYLTASEIDLLKKTI